MGSPFEMSKQTKIEQGVIKDFQALYFRTFPAIPKLHEWVRTKIVEEGNLVTPFGRKRWFFGRRDENDTLKQAVAHMGQSMTADEMNNAMLAVWRLNIANIMLQGHDSILVQYPEERENEVVPQLLQSMRVPLELEGGRSFVVPVECKVGWNWAIASDENPNGLSKYPDGRTRRYTQTR
jgi:DNA polymerase I-like protein with 3'-5' exonuclease and polymerase domains